MKRDKITSAEAKIASLWLQSLTSSLGMVVGLVAKSCLTLVTPWTVARQTPLSMGFSMQEYWSGLPFPPPGDLPNPGIEPRSPALQASSLPTELPGNSLGHSKNIKCSHYRLWVSSIFEPSRHACSVTSVVSNSVWPHDCSLPGSSVHGILQARILEWVAMPSSRGSFQPRDQTQVSLTAGRFFTIWATGEALWTQRFKTPISSVIFR